MKLTFLESSKALTKTFLKTPTGIQSEPYPHVKEFTSHTVEVANHREFAIALHSQGAQGHCLLKGNVAKPLVNESRAGSTISTDPTDYIVLDLDFNAGFNGDIGVFLAAIGIVDTACVFQRSASAGIKYGIDGLRGHIFVKLAQPVMPALLKDWLKDLNLTNPTLREVTELTASLRSLRFPLDITTCQNDKLIYISAPYFYDGDEELPDPLAGERIFTIDGIHDTWTFPGAARSVDAIQRDEAARIEELREIAGCPKSKAKFKAIGGLDVMTNPGRAAVTGVKSMRGYTYLNLNGGDSWAYYFPDGKPDIVFNFKGEPPILLKELNRDFWFAQQPQRVEANTIAYTFLNQRQDQHYTCVHNPATDDVQLTPVGSKELLTNFRGLHGQPTDALIPIWNVEFNPTTTRQIDPTALWVNTYQPPIYASAKPNPALTMKDMPTINRVINNVLADDAECIPRFINWLAYAFQTKQKAGVAWLLHGVEGTGKGVLFHNVISPLFGDNYCISVTDDALREKFNEFRNEKLFVLIDEINLENGNSRNTETNAANKLKSLVTESKTSIRAMRVSPVKAICYDNVILASNDRNPITISENDRRFNVPPRAEKKLDLTTDEILKVIPTELSSMAEFLAAYPVNEVEARTPVDNQARQLMVSQSMSSVDLFTNSLLRGEMQPFVDELKTKDRDGKQPSGLSNEYTTYDHIIRRILADSRKPNDGVFVSKEDLIAIFAYLRGETMTPGKMTKFLRMANLPITKRGNRQGLWIFAPPFDWRDEPESPFDQPQSPPALRAVK